MAKGSTQAQLLTQHQRLAQGLALPTSEEFGVEGLESYMAGGPGGPDTGHMPDHQRHPPIKNRGSAMHNQANPDHGPHHYTVKTQR